jgi:hypothetical protein
VVAAPPGHRDARTRRERPCRRGEEIPRRCLRAPAIPRSRTCFPTRRPRGTPHEARLLTGSAAAPAPDEQRARCPSGHGRAQSLGEPGASSAPARTTACRPKQASRAPSGDARSSRVASTTTHRFPRCRVRGDLAHELARDPHPHGLLGARQAARELRKPLVGVERAGRDLELGPEVVEMPAQPLLVLGAGGDEILAMVDSSRMSSARSSRWASGSVSRAARAARPWRRCTRRSSRTCRARGLRGERRPIASTRQRSRVTADGTVVLRDPATLRGVTVVHVLEEGRDAGHREDTLHGVASGHERELDATRESRIPAVDEELNTG